MVLFGLLFSGTTILNAQKPNPYHLKIISSEFEYKASLINKPQSQLVDVKTFIPSILLDIKYATPDNFTGKTIYTAPKAYLRAVAIRALKKVQDSLNSMGLGLKIFDAYRPYSATLKFFEVYPDTNFVANPRYGSRHNRGCTVDVTLVNLTTNQELAMPTAFDDFSAKASPTYPIENATIKGNRDILVQLMKHFEFMVNPNEWWHFDYREWNEYPLMDLTFSEVEGGSMSEP